MSKKCSIVIFILFLSIIASTLPILERGIRDPYNRTIGTKQVFRVIKRAGIRNTSVCLCLSDKTVTLRQTNGLSTLAEIYDQGGSEQKSGIVLIHGNTALGQKLPTYKVMSSKLSENGFVVLTYDQLGFGKSDNPLGRGPEVAIDAYDRIQMASAAVHYLVSEERVDKKNVTVIGHSGGAITALKIGLSMDEIRNIILIGPPRRVYERSKNMKDVNYFSERFLKTHFFVYGTPVPDWFMPDMTRKAGPWALEDYKIPFLGEQHKPIMLIDGELEGEEDKEYLEKIYADFKQPKKFLRLLNADHYHNTSQRFGFIFYDKQVAGQLISEITRFVAYQ